MKIQTSLMVLLLSSGSLFAKEVTNKSPEAEQVGYSFGYLLGPSSDGACQDTNLDDLSAE